MPPPKQIIWFDTNIIIDVDIGGKPNASVAQKSVGGAFKAEIISLQKDSYELLLPQHVKGELVSRGKGDLLNRLGFEVDTMAAQVSEEQISAWTQEGIKHSLSWKDARVVAEVRAGAQVRGIRNPVLFTRDAKALRAMRQRGVMAVQFRTNARMQIAADPPGPQPEVPAPIPPGALAEDGILGAIKEGLKAGLREVLRPEFIAENIGALIPDLTLEYADRVATQAAIRTIESKFIKEGFAKGVAAGVMGWTEQEVQSNLMNRVTNFRVQGLADPARTLTMDYILKLAEFCENYAVDVGYYFSFPQTLQWKHDMQAKGFEVLHKYGYYFGTDPQALFEYNFIDKLAWVLRPTTDSIVEPAIRFN